MKFILHPKQKQAIDLTKEHSVVKYVGGIRGGKTITGSHFALELLLERPNELGAIFAPTSHVLRTMTLKEFKKVLASYNIFQDREYVVGRNPKPYFGYETKFPDGHDGIWSFCNGCQIQTFSLESFYRGAEFGWAWGDEIQSSGKDDLDTVLGRMSGSAKPRTLYTYTPPSYNPDIDAITWGEKALPGVFGTTYDNQRNLPEGYIDMLKSIYDKYTFAREVMCERVTVAGLNWLHAFDRDMHVNPIARYNPKELVYISFDFNANPFVCTLWHRGMIKGVKYLFCFDEISMNPEMTAGRTYIEAMSDIIRQRVPNTPSQMMLITGDSSGRANNIMGRTGSNVFTEIQKWLKISDRQLKLLRKNPLHTDSRVLCNAIFANFDVIAINPKCVNLIRDCEFVRAKDNDEIMKDSRSDVTQQADMLDALRYFLHAFEGDFIRRM